MALKECTKKEEANSYELVVSVDGETFEKAICDDETTFDGKSLKGLLEERKTSHKK